MHEKNAISQVAPIPRQTLTNMQSKTWILYQIPTRLTTPFKISCYEGSRFLFNGLVASEAVKATSMKVLVNPSTEPDTLGFETISGPCNHFCELVSSPAVVCPGVACTARKLLQYNFR